MIFSRMKRAFEVKWKAFFLVWQVLSLRLKKQTSKSVADTTFNLFIPLSSRVAWCPPCNINLIPFYCLLRDRLLSKTEVRLFTTNILDYDDALCIGFSSIVLSIYILSWLYVEFPFTVFWFNCFKDLHFCLELSIFFLNL